MRRSQLMALSYGALLGGACADLSNAPEYFGPVDGAHAQTNRVMICAPSLTVVTNGRLWATWFTGPTPGEDVNNFVVLATSADGGDSWREVWCVDPETRRFTPSRAVLPSTDLERKCLSAHAKRSRLFNVPHGALPSVLLRHN